MPELFTTLIFLLHRHKLDPIPSFLYVYLGPGDKLHLGIGTRLEVMRIISGLAYRICFQLVLLV